VVRRGVLRFEFHRGRPGRGGNRTNFLRHSVDDLVLEGHEVIQCPVVRVAPELGILADIDELHRQSSRFPRWTIRPLNTASAPSSFPIAAGSSLEPL